MNFLGKSIPISLLTRSPAVAKGIQALMSQKLEHALNLFQLAARDFKDQNFDRAAFWGVAAAALAGRHYKARPKDSMKVLLIAEGIVRAAVARGAAPFDIEFKGLTSHMRGEDPCCPMGTSPAAQSWVSHKIRLLRREGYPEAQSKAIAYSMARKQGYKIPKPGVSGGLDRYARIAALLGMLDRG